MQRYILKTYFDEQSYVVQECDATAVDLYSTVRYKKILQQMRPSFC